MLTDVGCENSLSALAGLSDYLVKFIIGPGFFPDEFVHLHIDASSLAEAKK
jgi:hypothetical protein